MKLPYHTILCPTDLTAAGDDAVDLAYALAHPTGVVHLLHVAEPAYVTSPLDATPVMLAGASPEAMERVETHATQHMNRLVPEDALVRGVRTETHVVQDVDPAAVIEREAKRLGAEVLVVGTHGRRAVSNLLMGSVATALLRHATLPVILARPPKR